VLFARLLTAGAVPDVAVFVDGLNDFFFYDDRPALTPMLEQWVAESNGPRETDVAELVRRLPVVDLVARHLPGPPAAMLGKPAPVVDPKTAIRRVIARYLANKRAIEGMAKRFGVRPVFVWQPVPTWKYDAARFAPGSGDFGCLVRRHPGGRRRAALPRPRPLHAPDVARPRRVHLRGRARRGGLVSRVRRLLVVALTVVAACGTPSTPPVVVCIGDSITRGVQRPAVGGQTIQYDALGGFPGRLQRLLGSRARVVNRGVGGSTAEQWLLAPSDPAARTFRLMVRHGAALDGFPPVPPDARAGTVLEAVLRADAPDVVVVVLGTNDVNFERAERADVDQVADTVAARVDRVHDVAARVADHVLVSTLLPNQRDPMAFTQATNARIRDHHPDYVPLGERLTPLWRALLADGIHPNEAGYAAMAAIVAAELERRDIVPPVTAGAAGARRGTVPG